LILSGDLLVKQASLSDGVSFDACAFEQDGVASAKVDVSWRQIIQALMVAPVVVMLDERCGLRLQITGEVIVSSRMRFLSVWCQRSILLWVWG
jgi:hypothetical protein